MEAKVILHEVKEQYLLDDDAYEFLLSNLNTPLPVACVWRRRDGTISSLTVHAETDPEVITLFYDNKVTGEFINGTKLRIS